MANRKERRRAKVEFKRTYERRFGWIRQINLTDEYVKLRVGLSTLSELKQSRLLEYIRFRYLNEPKFKETIDNLDKFIIEQTKDRLESKLEDSNESSTNS